MVRFGGRAGVNPRIESIIGCLKILYEDVASPALLVLAHWPVDSPNTPSNSPTCDIRVLDQLGREAEVDTGIRSTIGCENSYLEEIVVFQA
jgi:hypothetical protein